MSGSGAFLVINDIYALDKINELLLDPLSNINPVTCFNYHKGKRSRYAICIVPQVKCSTSEALSMDHTAFYTAHSSCRLYRVVRQRAPRLNEQL